MTFSQMRPVTGRTHAGIRVLFQGTLAPTCRDVRPLWADSTEIYVKTVSPFISYIMDFFRQHFF